MASSRRSPPAAASRRPIWLIVAIIALLLAAIGTWLLWPREDKLAAVSELQRQVLAAGGTPSRGDIARVMQTVDRMDHREVWAAYRAAGEQWKRIKQEAIEAYFDAEPQQRPPLLDQQIERLVAYHDLLLEMNPNARPGSPAFLPRERRRRRGEPDPEPEPEKTAAEIEAEQARRELAERFDEAIEARARARGIALPAFR
jgi:hypothetical protein